MLKFPLLPSGSRANIEFSSEVLRIMANRGVLILDEDATKKRSPISGLNDLSLKELKELYAYSHYISDGEIAGIISTGESLKGKLKIIEAIGRARLAIESCN